MDVSQRHSLLFVILDTIQKLLDDLSAYPHLKPVVEKFLQIIFAAFFSLDPRDYVYVGAAEEAA